MRPSTIAIDDNDSHGRPFRQVGVDLNPSTDDLSKGDKHFGIVDPRQQEGSQMDFDPRDYDPRDEDRAPTPDRGGRGGSDRDHERDDDWCRPGGFSRDRDDKARDFGRGPGDSRESHSVERGRDARDDARWSGRERDERTRDTDPREVLARHLNLPRGPERELVRDRDREYTLRGSESRTMATVGAFRVVSSRDLQDYNGRPTDPRSGDLRHLREQGLVETVRVPSYREQT